jgi:hypothetical protein
MTNNRDEKHFWVGLMQADGLNQLATASGGRGDDGDPFPGRANNTSFNFVSNPNSRAYSGQDSYVSITNISPAAQNMSMLVSVRSFTPVYAQGEPGNGIGGYDLRSRADLSFAFDYDSSGKVDHLVLYRPGTGTCWILGNSNGAFRAKYARGDPGNGIGGYDLQSPADRGLAFDYDSSGKLDHLVFYCCVEAECHFHYLGDSGLYMYTKAAAWATVATVATPLPMWGVEGSGMVL